GPAAPGAAARSLFEVRWQVEQTVLDPQASGMVLLTGHGTSHELPTGLAARWEVPAYPDVASVLAAVEAGARPQTLLLPLLANSEAHADVPASVRAVTADVLSTVQAWLAAGVLAGSTLVVVTRGAVAVRSGDRVTDLAGAAVWGLLRSAQSEHPGRVVLVDLDADADTDLRGLLGWAAGGASGGQVAVRTGEVFVPRLVRASAPVASEPPVVGAGTVLVTGGTGALGALVAEHLVAAYGVRSLVLVSRQGPAASGADALVE
ncbi:SpnB-like Rossmann fold domain-containing protein, partial [Micromonospora echinospora]